LPSGPIGTTPCLLLDEVRTTTRQGTVPAMSTPSEVRELIDRLAGNIYDAYYGIEHSGPAYSGEQGWTAARFLARNLLRKGRRKAGLGALPHCPYGRCHHCNRQGHSRIGADGCRPSRRLSG
jgi:hypothetical protein